MTTVVRARRGSLAKRALAVAQEKPHRTWSCFGKGKGMLIAAFVDDTRLRGQIERQLRGHAQLRFCDTRPDILRMLERVDFAALLCQVQDRRGQSVAPLIRTVRQRHSMLPIVAILRPARIEDARGLVPAVRAGLNDVLLEQENAWEALKGIVRRGRLDCTTLALIRASSRHVPHGARLLVEQYFWSIGPRSNVQQVADAFGISRRTLGREHKRYGLPNPSKLVAWSRVLAAGCLLGSVRTVPTEQIARLVGFSSSSALRRATRDVADTLPSDLRIGQSFDGLLKRFATELKQRSARSARLRKARRNVTTKTHGPALRMRS